MWQLELFGFTFYQLYWFFILYAVLGWCAEVVFCTVNTGVFVNRGFLNGPVCPIYGAGMVIVLCALSPVAESLPLLFIGGALLATGLELVTGWVLEKLFHTRWWDYSDKPFNIGGYVCLAFSLLWGLLILLVVRVLHPLVALLVAAVPYRAGCWLALPVTLVFTADLAVTVQGVLKLDRSLGELERLASGLHHLSDNLSELLGEHSLRTAMVLEEKGQQLTGRLEGARQQAGQEAAAYRQELEQRRAELKAKYNALAAAGPGRVARRLIRAFPDMHRPAGADFIRELRGRLRGHESAGRIEKDK